MKKLKLDIEAIEVESFATKARTGIRGTVHARTDVYTNCWPYACGDSVNNACATYGTACPPYCTGGDTGDICNSKRSACYDCDM